MRKRRRDRWTAPDFLTDPGDPCWQRWAVDVLQAYFAGPDSDGLPDYTGARFERFAGGGDRDDVAHRFDVHDVVAVTMLSVSIDARATLRLLDTESDDLAKLLAGVPCELELIDAADEQLEASSPISRLYSKVRSYERVGETRASKLLARKRPRLVPIVDSVVRSELSMTSSVDYWRELRDYFQADRARWQFLCRSRSAAGLEDISVLRCFDVLL